SLTILMSRERTVEPPRHDPEPQMSRAFTLPSARTFSVGGTAQINAGDSDFLINQLLGLTPPGLLPKVAPPGPGAATVVAANSSTRLDGDRQARANATVDGDSSTAWIAETGPQSGEWLSVTLDKPVTFDHLDLRVINDGRHSLPTRVTISTETGSRTVTVPSVAVGTGRPQGSTSVLPVSFPPIQGSHIKVTIDAIRQVRDLDYYATFTGATDILPVGIAELGLSGVEQPAAPADLPAPCQPGLLTVDGRPVDVQITGTTAAALAGEPLQVHGCGNSAAGIDLGPGQHVVETSPRLPSGWSIDSLDLGSAAGGGAASAHGTVPTASAAATPAPGAVVQVEQQDRTSMDVRVTGDGGPFWLVLGQSFSSGWSASVAGGPSLGTPQLVDGYANGWYVPAGVITGPVTVHLSWTPQGIVTAAIIASAAGLVLCVLIAAWPDRWSFFRRRRRRPHRRRGEGDVPAAWSPRPALREPDLAGSGARLGSRRIWLGAVGWAVLCGVVSRPVIGLVAGAAVIVAGRWRHGRLAVRGLTVAALIAVPGYVIVQQVRYRYWPTIDWPTDVSSANDLAWLALAFLGADLVAGLLQTRAALGGTLARRKMGRP
ncbi:MAG TPA: discoidin domain-containing protein, partial [Nakamurella sp.]